jgi:hypothetical protein
MVRRAVLRVTVALTLLLGTVYVGWRWMFSVSWGRWWIAVPLVIATVVLVVACVIGVVRLWLHAETSTVGTAVNVARVGYDLLVMGIICRAALFRVPEPTTEATS